MKRRIKILTALILIQGLCYSQSTLEINVKDCREQNCFTFLSEFKLYKNDSLFKVVMPRHESKQTIKHLKNGLYRIDYKTIFGRMESVSIPILEKGRHKVDLCMNSLNYELESYTPFIDQLKNKDKYEILISSIGCFHSSEEFITVEKKDDKYYSQFGELTKELNELEIEALRHFELELNYMRDWGCTTIDSYVLTFGTKEVSISDGSCSWNGHYYLQKHLGWDNK